MSQTHALVMARLPKCLSTITIDYFGRSCGDGGQMARLGQWEDCRRFANTHQEYFILRQACKGDYIDIINLISEKTIEMWGYIGLAAACRHGHINLCKHLIALGVRTWGLCLNKACRGGHLDIIELMISLGLNDWGYGLMGACRGGQLEIAKMMIAKGAKCYNAGLRLACKDSHWDIIDLMIAHGADDWDSALSIACSYSHPRLIKFMIEKGANMCTYCDLSICQHRSLYEKIDFSKA